MVFENGKIQQLKHQGSVGRKKFPAVKEKFPHQGFIAHKNNPAVEGINHIVKTGSQKPRHIKCGHLEKPDGHKLIPPSQICRTQKLMA